MSDFLNSRECETRLFCASCRLSPEWRAIMSAPDSCPFGITADNIPYAAAATAQKQSASRADNATAEVFSGGGLHQNAGPGTELKKLLKTWLRIEATPTCSCNARARVMDEEEFRSPGWCAAHEGDIVGWLREEATKRGLPFLDAAGRLLVRRAISNDRKNKARSAAKTAPANLGDSTAEGG